MDLGFWEKMTIAIVVAAMFGIVTESGLVGLSTFFFLLLIFMGRIDSYHLATVQLRRRKEIFENIYIATGATLFIALVIWYFIQDFLPLKDPQARGTVAWAIVVFLLGIVQFSLTKYIFPDDSKKRKIQAFQKKEFDIPTRRKKPNKKAIRSRLYGPEPVFAPDGSIVRTEIKNFSALLPVAAALDKEEELGEAPAIREAAEALGVEVDEDSVLTTRNRLFRAVKLRLRRGEIIRLQQLLQVAEDAEEAGFILFLQSLPAGRFPPLALPFAIFYAKKGAL
jgi:hypothetical protein